jgi:tRNA (guanine10-N2)-methyltransferase
VTAIYHTIPETRQKCIIEEFSYMAYEGAIDLKRPEVALQYFEECMSRVLIGRGLITPLWYRPGQKHE